MNTPRFTPEIQLDAENHLIARKTRLARADLSW